MDSTSHLRLADVLKALRSELDVARARLATSGEPAMLALTGAEVELSFTVEQKGGIGGGFEFNVLGVGLSAKGDGERKSTELHRIKIELKPIAVPSPAPVTVQSRPSASYTLRASDLIEEIIDPRGIVDPTDITIVTIPKDSPGIPIVKPPDMPGKGGAKLPTKPGFDYGKNFGGSEGSGSGRGGFPGLGE